MSQTKKTRVLQWLNNQNRREVFFLQSRGPLQDGLSPVLGSREESETPKRQVGISCGAKKTSNRQAENDLQNKKAASGELSTRTVKAVTQVRDAGGRDKEFTRDKL